MQQSKAIYSSILLYDFFVKFHKNFHDKHQQTFPDISPHRKRAALSEMHLLLIAYADGVECTCPSAERHSPYKYAQQKRDMSRTIYYVCFIYIFSYTLFILWHFFVRHAPLGWVAIMQFACFFCTFLKMSYEVCVWNFFYVHECVVRLMSKNVFFEVFFYRVYNMEYFRFYCQ